MRLEKVNDNQIRCILSKEDLEIRQIKISELAYGSAKTKMLFKDVMQQASYEFGFEAENIPLMIEAIPMSTGCVVFIITKVENPEELDTRFSRFAPSVIEGSEEESEEGLFGDDDDNEYEILEELEDSKSENPDVSKEDSPKTAHIEIVGAEAISGLIDSMTEEGGVFDLFKKIAASAASTKNPNGKATGIKEDREKYIAQRVYMFADLDSVGKACRVLNGFFQGESSLYKNPEDNQFYLLLERKDSDKKDFIKIGNLMLEYSSYVKTTPASLAYLKEHYKCLLAAEAVEGMAQF